MDIWITPQTIIYECPECGNEVELGQNYCQNCGEPLNWRENEDPILCEMCESDDCCVRTDIKGIPVLCEKCYEIAKQNQEDSDSIEEIFKDN